MYNANHCQEKKVISWQVLLDEAKRLLAESESIEEKRELRKSVRAFESLIRQKAAMPQTRKSPRRKARAA